MASGMLGIPRIVVEVTNLFLIDADGQNLLLLKLIGMIFIALHDQ